MRMTWCGSAAERSLAVHASAPYHPIQSTAHTTLAIWHRDGWRGNRRCLKSARRFHTQTFSSRATRQPAWRCRRRMRNERKDNDDDEAMEEWKGKIGFLTTTLVLHRLKNEMAVEDDIDSGGSRDEKCHKHTRSLPGLCLESLGSFFICFTQSHVEVGWKWTFCCQPFIIVVRLELNFNLKISFKISF